MYTTFGFQFHDNVILIIKYTTNTLKKIFITINYKIMLPSVNKEQGDSSICYRSKHVCVYLVNEVAVYLSDSKVTFVYLML